MSAEARKRISDAQKARWAKQRGEALSTEATPTEALAAKPKRGGRGVRKGVAKRGPIRCLPQARRRISEARWTRQKRATN